MCDILEENDMDPSIREGLKFAITSSRERERKKKLANFVFAGNVEGLKLFKMKLN
jgi:hypothetical protein